MNHQTYLSKSVHLGNEITVIGWTASTDGKNGRPINGGYWKAGKVAVLNANGTIISNRDISISQYDDVINDIDYILGFTEIEVDENTGETTEGASTEGGIYISGYVSSYDKTYDDLGKQFYYGYGWIGELSLTNYLENNRYFGWPSGRRYLNSISVSDDYIYAFFGGVNISKDFTKAWVAKVKRASL